MKQLKRQRYEEFDKNKQKPVFFARFSKNKKKLCRKLRFRVILK
jgi:hypothetical protein